MLYLKERYERKNMNINWRLKSVLFRIIDSLSLFKVLYFLQKYITKRSVVRIEEISSNWIIHKENLSIIEKPSIIEFGAGKNLSQNIYLSQFVEKQTLVDLYPMLDISQFNDAALKISKITNKYFQKVYSVNDIKNEYKIDYIAPLDLTNSEFDNNQFDACISTNTLEHIPRGSIISIFKELFRIIRNNGIISAVIDYSDHYAHTDKNISKLNFLSYSAKEFKKYNHNSHYQNRLRHYDFLEIFNSIGFEIVKEQALNIEIPPKKISPEFNKISENGLATQGVFLLRIKK